MNPLSIASLGLGGIGMIGGLISGFGANSKLQQLQAQDPSYTSSPYASQRLGLAQTLLNARMPGATSMERNIYGNQANQLANVNRNATDGSQALALGASAQGQTNQAFQNLGTQEQQDYYNRLQNLGGAQQGMIAEGDKVYQDKVRQYGDKAAILGAQIKNTQTNWNSLANMGFGGAGIAAQYGGQGGFGGGQGQGASPAYGGSFMGMQTQQTGAGMQGIPAPNWINPYGSNNPGANGYPGFPM